MILIGTSGYSYRDWIGSFYPEDIKSDEMLKYYSTHFTAVEINSTFYNIPTLTSLKKMMQNTPPDFEFIIKAHKSLSHFRNPGPWKDFKFVLEAFQEKGKLGGMLVQFPNSFKENEKNRDYLLMIKDFFHSRTLPVFLEFRDISWIKEEAFSFLQKHELYYCSVDEPSGEKYVPPILRTTGEMAYIRFHGRNPDDWYDYSYSMNELFDWANKVKELTYNMKKIYIFFNNSCAAVENAKLFTDLLF